MVSVFDETVSDSVLAGRSALLGSERSPLLRSERGALLRSERGETVALFARLMLAIEAVAALIGRLEADGAVDRLSLFSAN